MESSERFAPLDLGMDPPFASKHIVLKMFEYREPHAPMAASQPWACTAAGTG
jgi:hypothetical protein